MTCHATYRTKLSLVMEPINGRESPVRQARITSALVAESKHGNRETEGLGRRREDEEGGHGSDGTGVSDAIGRSHRNDQKALRAAGLLVSHSGTCTKATTASAGSGQEKGQEPIERRTIANLDLHGRFDGRPPPIYHRHRSQGHSSSLHPPTPIRRWFTRNGASCLLLPHLLARSLDRSSSRGTRMQ